jgi:flavin-dependent dehydrogenase
MRYDVIICGSGPAGVTLANLHRGSRVVVLDARPFSKVCAELVTLREARALGAPIVYRSNSVEVWTPYGRRSYPVENALIEKHLWLSETHARSGAELIVAQARMPIIRDGRCVGVIADGEYYADTIYDCTGANRALVGQFSTTNSREYALCYQERVKARHGFASPVCYYDPKLVPGGYAWAFPRGGRELTIGLGTWPWADDLKERLRLFTKILKIEVTGTLERRASKLFLGLSRRTTFAGLRVAGEANGSCDPYTGSGIMQAVIDARKCYQGTKRKSGLLRKLSALALRNLPAGYLQALQIVPVPYVPYYP